MSNVCRLIARLVLAILVCPSIAFAQSAIAGIVTDTSGAVLPGVTVEASSSALIEKVRAATTDANGQYRVVDLRPGTYKVTFTLAGFATITRDNVLLEANFTAPINIQMPVGSIEETVTVSGASPVVDVQTSQRREVVSEQFLEVLPTGRSYALLAGTVPSVVTGAFDVGGSTTTTTTPTLVVHGSLASDSRTLIDGLVVDGMSGTGQCACLYDNEAQTQEIAVQVSGGSAEHQLSGVIVNRIPKSGSNRLTAEQLLQYSNGRLQGANVDQELRDRGITAPARLARQYDVNYSVGGPIVRDRLWFFFTGRHWSYNTYVANAFNPDGTQAIDDNYQKAFPIRLTTQLTRRDRVTGLYDWSYKYRGHQNLSPTVSPEATLVQTFPGASISQVKWTSTMTNHLLLETGFNYTRSIGDNQYRPEVELGTCHVAYNLCPSGTGYGDIAHQDTLLGTNTIASASGTGAFSGPNTNRHRSHVFQTSLSYVSGAHSLKTGVQTRWGWTTATRPPFNGDLNQLYRNGVPFAVTILNTPAIARSNVDIDLGVYVQDTWTMRRLTLNPGLRWDKFVSSIPEQRIAAGRFVPERYFAAVHDIPNWSNFSPRFGGSYDLSGRGRTAVKGNVGIYVQSQGPGFAALYNPMVTSTDQRTWSDLNGDDIAQENEIGPPSNLTFGVRRNQNPDPDIERPFQLVWDVGLQHELIQGLGVSVSYNQRSFYKIPWTDNLALDPSDYTLFNVPDPQGSGQLPVYSINAAKFGQVNELDMHSTQNARVYRGVDASFNLRLVRGASIYGGTSTGRTVSATCQVEDANSLRFCDETQFPIPLRTSFKLAGTYLLPYEVRISGTFQSTPGVERIVTYQVTRSLIPTLSQTSVNVRLNEPGTEFNDRINQLDLSVSRTVKVRRIEVRPEFSLFNVLNANPVLAQLNTFGPSLGRVTSILAPRVVRLGLTVELP